MLPSRGRSQAFATSGQQLAGWGAGMQEGDLDPEFLEMLGPGHMGRASSALEVPVMQVASSGSQEMEPYMPQWQSESVPAELPNHVVTRLMMGPSTSSQPPRGHSANLYAPGPGSCTPGF